MNLKYIDKIEFEDCTFNSIINNDPGYLHSSVCVNSITIKVFMKDGSKYSSKVEYCEGLIVSREYFPMLSTDVIEEINEVLNQNGEETLVNKCLELFETELSKIKVSGIINIDDNN